MINFKHYLVILLVSLLYPANAEPEETISIELSKCMNNALYHYVEEGEARKECLQRIKFHKHWIESGSNVILVTETDTYLNGDRSENLQDVLKERFLKKYPAIKLVVTHITPYSRFVNVMDDLKELGISAISIETILAQE